MSQAQAIGHVTPPHPLPPHVTLEEYLELFNYGVYEVWDGEIVTMSPQHIRSSWVHHILYDSLSAHVRQRKLGAVMIETVFALEIDPSTNWLHGSLVPDLAFVSAQQLKEQKEKYPGESAYRVAPILAVEVISPTDHFSAAHQKVRRYLKYGVRLVWVIDWQDRTSMCIHPNILMALRLARMTLFPVRLFCQIGRCQRGKYSTPNPAPNRIEKNLVQL